MFVRRISRLPHLTRIQTASTNATATAVATETLRTTPITDYRTTETKTIAHTAALHAAKFYTLPPAEKKTLFTGGGLPKQFEQQLKTFTEACLMVRAPALELFDYLRNTDWQRPAVRYVLYGDNGCGKTLTMAHVLHYGLQNGFVLVHVPWAPNWMKRPKETTTSSTQEGCIDLPFEAAAWLMHFKTQNANLLDALDLRTSRDYVWSKRETTPARATLLELLEHGITRIKFACDTVSALLNELKQHATAGRCKLMVAIDGYNAFFHPETRILGEHKQIITPDRITLTRPFLDITKYDWINGVCVLSVDKIAMTEDHMDSYMPRYLLGRTGFEHLDPFVPLHVGNYTEKEYASCIQYYLDRSWIQKTSPGFDQQLKYMSSMNPYTLMRLTRSL